MICAIVTGFQTCALPICDLPVFTLDGVYDRRAGPAQQRGNDQAEALAAARRSEGHDMLGPVVPEIATVMTTENGARVAEQSGAFHLANLGPARGAVGGDMALLPGAPERAEDRGGAADEADRKSTRLNSRHECD